MAENGPVPPQHCAGAEHLKAALSLCGADWGHLFCQTFPPLPCAQLLQHSLSWLSLSVLTQQQDLRGQIHPRLTELSAPGPPSTQSATELPHRQKLKIKYILIKYGHF